MATILEFDEIKKLGRSIPYKEFFGKMYITPEQMNTRIDLARDIEDVMLYVFAYWIIAAETNNFTIEDEEKLKQTAIDKLNDVIAKHTRLDPYLEDHIVKLVEEAIDATKKHAKKPAQNPNEDNGGDDGGKEDYWTSRDRAMLISENEANAFENYIEYREAKESGKTVKIWQTELDDKVRLTHEIAEGQTVDIDGLFLIGGSMMRFPMDTMYDPLPEETINCRCSCRYE